MCDKEGFRLGSLVVDSWELGGCTRYKIGCLEDSWGVPIHRLSKGVVNQEDLV